MTKIPLQLRAQEQIPIDGHDKAVRSCLSPSALRNPSSSPFRLCVSAALEAAASVTVPAGLRARLRRRLRARRPTRSAQPRTR